MRSHALHSLPCTLARFNLVSLYPYLNISNFSLLFSLFPPTVFPCCPGPCRLPALVIPSSLYLAHLWYYFILLHLFASIKFSVLFFLTFYYLLCNAFDFFLLCIAILCLFLPSYCCFCPISTPTLHM